MVSKYHDFRLCEAETVFCVLAGGVALSFTLRRKPRFSLIQIGYMQNHGMVLLATRGRLPSLPRQDLTSFWNMNMSKK